MTQVRAGQRAAWQYEPGSTNDTSVTGWQINALNYAICKPVYENPFMGPSRPARLSRGSANCSPRCPHRRKEKPLTPGPSPEGEGRKKDPGRPPPGNWPKACCGPSNSSAAKTACGSRSNGSRSTPAGTNWPPGRGPSPSLRRRAGWSAPPATMSKPPWPGATPGSAASSRRPSNSAACETRPPRTFATCRCGLPTA